MPLEERFRIALDSMPSCGVPRSAAVVQVTPRNWVIRTHSSSRICILVHCCEYVDTTAGISGEVVPLVSALPIRWEESRRWIRGIFDLNSRGLDSRVTLEIGSDQVTIPRPVVLRVASGMNSNKPPALLYVTLKGGHLIRVKYIPGGAQENHCFVTSKSCVTEQRCVLGSIHCELVSGT